MGLSVFTVIIWAILFGDSSGAEWHIHFQVPMKQKLREIFSSVL